MSLVLVIGGSDTGRAPIAAALLERMVAVRGLPWQVESAGVVGHDGEAAQPEAQHTAAHLGLNLAAHRARSLSDELVATATLLLAIDSGTARALRARFPHGEVAFISLGELAGRQRDVPDPFRMQIGAWIAYTREIEQLLEDALPQLVTRVTALASPKSAPEHAPPTDGPFAQLQQLLTFATDTPSAPEWASARSAIDAELTRVAATDPLTTAYVALLRGALALSGAAPTAGQLAALRGACEQLAAPITANAVSQFSAQLAEWPTL